MDYLKIDCKDEKFPQKLLQIKNCPKELYIMGDYKLLDKQKIVAIIGSRDCTHYGIGCATEFACELSKQDICIVSGMAIGIDAYSHIGALGNIGKTIAVLGGGFNKIYPKQNEWLFYTILKNGGCVITEYEPNIEADKMNFPKRNRLVSGLSDVVLVVEAEYRSGTSITVNYAKEQNKLICCIPSNIDSSRAIGINTLIKEGVNLVTKPNEIVEMLKNMNESEKTNLENIKENVKRKNVPIEYANIYNLITQTPIHINDICKLSQINTKEVSSILTMLELEDYIEQLPGNKFKIKE